MLFLFYRMIITILLLLRFCCLVLIKIQMTKTHKHQHISLIWNFLVCFIFSLIQLNNTYTGFVTQQQLLWRWESFNFNIILFLSIQFFVYLCCSSEKKVYFTMKLKLYRKVIVENMHFFNSPFTFIIISKWNNIYFRIYLPYRRTNDKWKMKIIKSKRNSAQFHVRKMWMVFTMMANSDKNNVQSTTFIKSIT